MSYFIQLQAGIPVLQPLRGKNILIKDTGAAAQVALVLLGASLQDRIDIGNVGSYFSVTADTAFSGLELTSAVPCTVEVLVTEFKIQALDGANLTVTIGPGSIPLQVREDVASAAIDNAAVAVTDAGAVLIAANPLRKSARFNNIGTSAVVIGAAGITWAKRVIVLQPGDAYFEAHGANLSWSAITDVAPNNSASVTVQEVLA